MSKSLKFATACLNQLDKSFGEILNPSRCPFETCLFLSHCTGLSKNIQSVGPMQ